MKLKTPCIKKITVGLVFFITALVTFLFRGIHPAVADVTDPDRCVFDLINQYRAAPFAQALALGYDAAFLLEKGIVPQTVFPPYNLDAYLCKAASNANARAAAADPNPDPVPPVRRLMAQTGSVFSFSRFMPIETASQLFVENLFKTELETGEFAFVLSDAFQYAGIGADPGVVTASQMNAWFFTLILGSLERVSEMQMLNMINQMRAEITQEREQDQLDLIEFYLDTDLPVLLQQNPQIYQLPNMKFGPVFIDEMLQQWARTDIDNFVDPDIADPEKLAPDTVYPGQDTFGSVNYQEMYRGDFFQIATVASFWEDMAAARPVVDLFSDLLRSELSTWPDNAVMFSNHFTRAGVAIHLETAENAGTGILSFFAGSPVVEPIQPETLLPEMSETLLQEETIDPLARIYGVLFTDHDDDYIYSPGEEEIQHVVTVFPLPLDNDTDGVAEIDDDTKDHVKTVVTDNAGHFSINLEAGRYWVFEAQKDGRISRRIIYIENDHFVKMVLIPPFLTP